MKYSTFCGEFNKSAGYFGWQDSEEFEHFGSMDEFNKDIYDDISAEAQLKVIRKTKDHPQEG